MGMDAIGVDIQRAKSSRAQVFFGFFFVFFCNIFGMDVIGIDIQRSKSSRARVFFILFFCVFYLSFAVLFFLATNMMVMG